MRNTINSFTGVHVRWSGSGGIGMQAFLTMPVARLPNNLERERLRNNEFDQEHWERILWSLHMSDVRIGDQLDTEWYLVGIREKDRPSLLTRNRDFLTAGFRARNSGEIRAYEIETAIQHGTSRATLLPIDTTDIDHRAWCLHAEAGRRLKGGVPVEGWIPQERPWRAAVLQYRVRLHIRSDAVLIRTGTPGASPTARRPGCAQSHNRA